MVMPVDLPDIELYELLLHELTHIFQYHILFGGSLGRALTSSPPQWLMEGMASYFAKDESAADRMYLRDAVVNDRLPPITSGQAGGFFAYRYGHAAFDFMEERWGADGVIDFLFEFRNTIGSRVGRAIERAFPDRSGRLRPGVPALAPQPVPARAGGDRGTERLRPSVPNPAPR